MARPSPLSTKKWDELEARYLAGESARSLGKEYGVPESSIRKRCAQVVRIKDVANQVVAADAAFKSLPFSAQVSAQTLIDELKAISAHLAGAARFGSATAHRLAGIAHNQVQMIDDSSPLDAQSIESLKGVAILTKMSNDASVIGLGLLNANKESVKIINNAPPALARTINPAKLSDAAIKELMLARA